MTNLKKNYFDCLWEKYLSQAIKTFPKNFWNFDMLTKNPNITWDIVQANPDKPWCFFGYQKIQTSHGILSKKIQIKIGILNGYH